MFAFIACSNIEAFCLADFLYMSYGINGYSKFIKQIFVLWNEGVCLLLLLGRMLYACSMCCHQSTHDDMFMNLAIVLIFGGSRKALSVR